MNTKTIKSELTFYLKTDSYILFLLLFHLEIINKKQFLLFSKRLKEDSFYFFKEKRNICKNILGKKVWANDMSLHQYYLNILYEVEDKDIKLKDIVNYVMLSTNKSKTKSKEYIFNWFERTFKSFETSMFVSLYNQHEYYNFVLIDNDLFLDYTKIDFEDKARYYYDIDDISDLRFYVSLLIKDFIYNNVLGNIKQKLSVI